MQKKTDRRVRKTKSQLRKGLAHLMKEKSISVSAALILIWTHICMNRPVMMGGFLICPLSLILSCFPNICAICKNRKAITIQMRLRAEPSDALHW